MMLARAATEGDNDDTDDFHDAAPPTRLRRYPVDDGKKGIVGMVLTISGDGIFQRPCVFGHRVRSGELVECLVRYASAWSAGLRPARHAPVWSGDSRQARPSPCNFADAEDAVQGRWGPERTSPVQASSSELDGNSRREYIEAQYVIPFIGAKFRTGLDGWVLVHLIARVIPSVQSPKSVSGSRPDQLRTVLCCPRLAPVLINYEHPVHERLASSSSYRPPSRNELSRTLDITLGGI